MKKDGMKPENIKQAAFFTGHRVLRNSDLNIIREKVFQCISGAYDSGYRRFYCGCARGFDMLAAFETIRMSSFPWRSPVKHRRTGGTGRKGKNIAGFWNWRTKRPFCLRYIIRA